MIKRFYINQSLEENSKILLEQDTAHYLRNVLRLKENNDVIIFNGDNHIYHAKIIEQGKKRTLLGIEKKEYSNKEPKTKVHLAQTIIKSEKMDYAIQKAVELGVHEITPIYSERCQINLKNRTENKMQHWSRIIISSCEQSGRNYIPKLNELQNFQEFVRTVEGKKYILSPHTNENKIEKADSYSILVGPEGGFTEEEEKVAEEYGINKVKLGNIILRAETAPIVMLSIIHNINI